MELQSSYMSHVAELVDKLNHTLPHPTHTRYEDDRTLYAYNNRVVSRILLVIRTFPPFLKPILQPIEIFRKGRKWAEE